MWQLSHVIEKFTLFSYIILGRYLRNIFVIEIEGLRASLYRLHGCGILGYTLSCWPASRKSWWQVNTHTVTVQKEEGRYTRSYQGYHYIVVTSQAMRNYSRVKVLTLFATCRFYTTNNYVIISNTVKNTGRCFVILHNKCAKWKPVN